MSPSFHKNKMAAAYEVLVKEGKRSMRFAVGTTVKNVRVAMGLKKDAYLMLGEFNDPNEKQLFEKNEALVAGEYRVHYGDFARRWDEYRKRIKGAHVVILHHHP